METVTQQKFTLAKDLDKKARLLRLIADQTRIRILCFMLEEKKACVSSIAQALHLNIANTSYHLQLMKEGGFFSTRRMGNEICYELVKNEFTDHLEKIICD